MRALKRRQKTRKGVVKKVIRVRPMPSEQGRGSYKHLQTRIAALTVYHCFVYKSYKKAPKKGPQNKYYITFRPGNDENRRVICQF
jgi:hypothetical protein